MSLEGRSMRFGGFVWRRNPETLRMEYERTVKRLTLPRVGEALQDLGCRRRVTTGRGSFLGRDAAAEFERLEAAFRAGGSAMLCLPGVAPFRAVFASLQMLGEARPNAVTYSFQFLEHEETAADDGVLRKRVHTCTGEETLWTLAARFSTTVDALLACNPLVMWPNRLDPGTEVALP